MPRCVVLTSAVVFLSLLGAGRAKAETPAEIIKSFASQNNAAAWVKGRAYMRRLEDDTWKTRMQATQKLVAMGKTAVPALIEATSAQDDATRIFATQTLGYLAPHAPRDRLLELAKNDSNAAVRLYAVDAIGMQGGRDPTAELNPLKKTEKNRDVLKHIGYAIERGKQGVGKDVVERLTEWDPKKIDTAVVGEVAPDFQLTTPDGETIRLSDFRDKRAVVLVFVYGDT